MVRLALAGSKFHKSRSVCHFGSLLYAQKFLAHRRSLIHACWMNGGVENVTMRVGSYGRRQVKTWDKQNKTISDQIAAWFTLGLRCSYEDRTIGGLVLKTLNSKAMWLGGLHMVDWIECRYYKPWKRGVSVSKWKINSLEVTKDYLIHMNFASNTWNIGGCLDRTNYPKKLQQEKDRLYLRQRKSFCEDLEV